MAFISKLKFPTVFVGAIGLLAVTAVVAAAHESREAGDFSYIVGWADEPAYEGFPNALSVRINGPIETAVGALFEGSGLNPGEEFTFTFGHDLEESTVPFHNHISPELGGTVLVTDSAPEGDVEIEITTDGFNPANVMVQPGSSVTWHNIAETVQAVHSGEGRTMDMHDDAADDDHAHESEAAPTGPVAGLDGALQVEVTHLPTGITRTMTLTEAFRDPGHYTAPLIPTTPGAYAFHLTGEIHESMIDLEFESGPGTFDDVQTQASIQFPLEVSSPREVEGAARGAQDAALVAESAAEDAAGDASSAQTLAMFALVVGIGGLAVGAGGVVIGLRKK